APGIFTSVHSSPVRSGAFLLYMCTLIKASDPLSRFSRNISKLPQNCLLLEIANNPCAPPCTGPTPFIQKATVKLPVDFNSSGKFAPTKEPPGPICAASPAVTSGTTATPGTKDTHYRVVATLYSPVTLALPSKGQ